MPINNKKRDEVGSEFKWDLSIIFKSDELWNKEYDELESKLDKFDVYKGDILTSSTNLLNILSEYYEFSKRLSKLHVYSYMKSDEDTGNIKYQILKGKSDNLRTKFSEKTSFMTPELLKSDYSIIEEYIVERPELFKYKRVLKNIYRYANHTLSEVEEGLLSTMSKVFDSSNKVAGLVRNTDLKFGQITDEDGNLVNITNSNYSKYIESFNRSTRKNSFLTLYKGYESVKNTLASTIASEVEGNIVIAKIRKYKNVRSMSLFNNEIDEEIYDNLVKVVNENLSPLHKYYKLKKEHLKLDELALYDVHVPLIVDNTKYSFEYGSELVIKSLSILGEDYINVVKKSFEDRWIDIYPNQFKRSGAYSWGTYDTPPYILLNYQNKLGDVSTLAHELGHSLHSYYSRNNNEYQDSQYKIFVAEVASITNELLLYKYMLEESKNKLEKMNVLNNMMELFRNTLYRQTMFAEFEMEIYELASNDEILTHELLSNTYYDLNKKYFGSDVYINEEIKYEWARIPHFYTMFYVYQYATGLAAACYIVKNITNNVDGATSNYLKFLKTGSRDKPVELLKIAGVDMSDPEVILSAVEWFDEIIDEFQKLSSE